MKKLFICVLISVFVIGFTSCEKKVNTGKSFKYEQKTEKNHWKPWGGAASGSSDRLLRQGKWRDN